MSKNSKEATMVLIFGLVGIIGALLTTVSDFILLGTPNSAYTYFKLGTESMSFLSQWRITIGTFLGILALPLQIAGLITIYFGLKPGGKIMSLVVVFTMTHASIMGVAFHMSYAFIGSGWKLSYAINTKNMVAFDMMNKFIYYWKLLLIIMAIELTLSSIFYVLLILRRDTLYPKWMAIFNPSCVIFYIYFIILQIPYPIGGFMAPAFLNLAALTFLTLSTYTVYRMVK